MLFFRECWLILRALIGAGGEKGRRKDFPSCRCFDYTRSRSVANLTRSNHRHTNASVTQWLPSGAFSKIPGSVHRSQTVECWERLEEGQRWTWAGQKGVMITPWRMGHPAPSAEAQLSSLLPRAACAGGWHQAKAWGSRGK